MDITTSTLGAAFANNIEKAVDKAIKEVVPDGQPGKLLPDSGVAVAVIKDNELCFAGGFGLSNRKTGKKVTAKTCFAIGSATKAFTGMLASMLVEDGMIRFEDPIRKFLPNFKLKESEASKQMDLESILSHRTGLPRNDALWYLAPFNRSQLYYRLRHLAPDAAHAGKTFRYNNMMYGIAGDVLEAVSHKSWDDLLQERILGRLEMLATTSSLEKLKDGDYARGYVRGNNLELRDYSNIAPAAAINSNVIDMAKWVLLFLNGGVSPIDGRLLVNPQSMQKIKADLADVDPSKKLRYGLGWFNCEVQGKQLFFHQGDAEGHSAYVSFMPDPGLGVIVLTNEQCTLDLVHKWPDKVAEEIYKKLLDDRPVNLPSMRNARNFREAPDGKREVPNPGDYAGLYSDDAYGDVAVNLSGPGLTVRYYGKDFGPLRRTSPLVFDFDIPAIGTSIKVPATFTRADTGKIDKLKIDFTPFDDKTGPITFAKR